MREAWLWIGVPNDLTISCGPRQLQRVSLEHFTRRRVRGHDGFVRDDRASVAAALPGYDVVAYSPANVDLPAIVEAATLGPVPDVSWLPR
ncbi:hypothetical protein [Dactylosporangium sp. NPDC051541]|uniref:hypothetical protein n=1 Tax=Dactylosporangium sp. NPDC051541 TaxID=3363977 RepID=UPI0037AE0C39